MSPMVKPVQIAVVGHTNAGKTSLLRTLTRRVNFGEVSEQPGTTRNPQSSNYEIDGECVVKFWDTPGLEDSTSLHHYLKEFQSNNESSSKWIHAFLKAPEASKSFEQEAKVLRKMLDVDAAIYVIDCRANVLPKYQCEIQILSACAKPIIPVLNFVQSADSQEEKWSNLLATNNMHALVRFDAVAPFIGSERQLYEDLSRVLKDHHEHFQLVTKDIERQARERRVSSCRVLADLLVSVTAMRRMISEVDLADNEQKADFVHDFKRDLVMQVRVCIVDLLEVHAFRRDDANVAIPTGESGRWESDVLNLQLLLDDGKLMGASALVGVVVGLAIDAALAGTSLGAASAIGAAIGGIFGEGWGKAPRKFINRVRKIQELTLEKTVLIDLIDKMVRLIKTLETRGHAAMDKVDASSGLPPETVARIGEVAEALKPARSDPKWERQVGSPRPNNKKRGKLVGVIEKRLLAILKL